MQAWQITRFSPQFDFSNLQLGTFPVPTPGAGEVLIRVHAVSLNYRDLLMVRGHYNPRMALPRIPCSDLAGEVAALGSGVSTLAIGDRVTGLFMPNWIDGPLTAAKARGALGGDADGTLAEYMVLPAAAVLPIPDHLSYNEAATLPCAAVTAWNALVNMANIQPGQSILVQGTGGVSIFALQFAKLFGARVLGTSSSDAKLEHAKTLGLDAGFNYKDDPGWAKWAVDQTGGPDGAAGVDVVVEVGGSGTLPESLKAVRPEGIVTIIGVLTGVEEPVSIPLLLRKQIRVQGIYVGSGATFEAMNAFITRHQLRPVIDRVFPFHDAPAAFRYQASGAHFGKVVVEVSA